MHEKNQPPELSPIQVPAQPMPMPMPMPPAKPNMPNMPMPGNPCYMPDMTGGAESYMPEYPDIYHKVQPHVSAACDDMEMHGWMMPTTRMMRCMCDHIHQNVMQMYPEMANYGAGGMSVSDYDPVGGGPVRDVIAILLLAELFRRRRVY